MALSLTVRQNKAGLRTEELPPHEQYIIDVLLNVAQGATLPKEKTNVTPTPAGVQPCLPDRKGIPVVVPVLLSTLDGISHIRLFMPKDIRQDQARETLWKAVLEVQRRFKGSVPLLDPIDNMGIKDAKFRELVKVGQSLTLTIHLPHLSSRKLKHWKKKCSQVPCIKIPVCQNCMPCIQRKRRVKNGFAISKKASRQHTTFSNLKNSNAVNAFSVGWDSLLLRTSSMSKVE